MANLVGQDQFNLSQAIGMALRNASNNKKMRKWIIQNVVR